MNHWEAARLLTFPGIKVQAQIDPTTLSVRIKNAAKRMLVAGHIYGGYRSAAARVAEALATNYDVPFTRENYYTTMTISQLPTTEVVEEVVKLIQADLATQILETSAQKQAFVQANLNHFKVRAADAIRAVRCGESHRVTFNCKEFFNKTLHVIAANRPAYLSAKGAEVASMLYDSTPIPLPNIRNMY